LHLSLFDNADAFVPGPQDEAALENLVLERGLPSVEFIWCAHP
jgi:hypothetical protein